jgi:hypothetical protein
MATYDRKVKEWMRRKNVSSVSGTRPAHDTTLDVLFATSLYGGQYYTQYNGMTFERSAHFRALAEDLATHAMDMHNRPPSLNEVADVKGFNFFLDFDCVAPVEEDFVNKLVPPLIGVFIESMEGDVDYSGVQVVVTTTLDDSYEMTTYVEQRETCPLCDGEVACSHQDPNRLECRGCKAYWSWTPSGPLTDQTIYLESYGTSSTGTSSTTAHSTTATPTWVSRPKSGFHIRFHNATVTLRQAQDLTNAMRQKAMTVHRDVTADQWQSVIDQAPLVRKEGTKTIGLRLPYTCKGQACRACRGKGRVPDYAQRDAEVACVGCHGAGKVALRDKTYGILNVWYPCTARLERDGQWVVKNLRQLVREAEDDEQVGDAVKTRDYAGAGEDYEDYEDGGDGVDGWGLRRGSGHGPRGPGALACGPSKRGADGAPKLGPASPPHPVGPLAIAKRRMRFTEPSELWPKTAVRRGEQRPSTPLEELTRLRPQTVSQYLYCLELCSIASVNPTQQCMAKVSLPAWCPVDNPVQSDRLGKKQLGKFKTGYVTLARWNQAKDTQKYARVDPDKNEIIADIMRGTDEIYAECVVSGAYWMDSKRTCILCYADGPGSNYCMCLQREHQSSRAKFVIHAVYGVRIKCSSIKVSNACVRWEGTQWKRLDPVYHALLFGGGDDGSAEAAYDVPRLVDKYEFLKEHFSGKANLHLLHRYYSRLQNAACVLNVLRCAHTKKGKVHCVAKFLEFFNKTGGIECTRAPLAAEKPTVDVRGASHVLAVTAAGAATRSPHPTYVRLRERVDRMAHLYRRVPREPEVSSTRSAPHEPRPQGEAKPRLVARDASDGREDDQWAEEQAQRQDQDEDQDLEQDDTGYDFDEADLDDAHQEGGAFDDS